MDAATDQELAVRVLGPLRAFAGDREIELGPPLQRALFAVLAFRSNHVVYRAELIDALWGEELPTRPEGGVHTYVAGLRRAFEPGRGHRSPGRVIESRGSGYLLRAASDAIDLARFERCVETARTAVGTGALAEAERHYDEALGLFDGAALGGVPGPFAATQRDRLAEVRLGVVEDRIDVVLARGRHAAVIGDLRTMTREYPLRERAWSQLMLAFYRAGRQADALAAFDRAREACARDLGLDPGPALRELRQRILVADPALTLETRVEATVRAPAAARRNLPRDIEGFIGRDQEMIRVLSSIDRPGGRADRRPATGAVPGSVPPLRVFAIDGMAGVGKTSLAVRLAHRLADDYPDGQLYLDLHAHTVGQEPLTAATALDRLLRAVGVPGDRIPVEAEERAATWRAELADRRMLLVLDNASGAAQVRPLLPGTAGSLVLITARRRLPGLQDCEFLSLDVLPAAEAATLFALAAGDVRPAAEPEATAAVVRICGNLPLAVQIAGARLRHRAAWSIAHLLDRLGDEDRRLAELRVEDRSVAAAFGLSYQSQTPDRQRIFRLLGLFPGPEFTVRAAAALAGADVRDTDEALEDLVDAHLLDQSRAGRYRFHDLLGVFAARQCRAQESESARRAAMERLLDFYVLTVDNAEELIRPHRLDRADRPPDDRSAHRFDDRAAALAWLDAERAGLVPLVRAAGEYGLDHQGWQIARYLWGFFETRRLWADWVACYELALPCARRAGDPLAEARILVGLGACCHDLREYAEAIGHYRRALDLMRQIGFRSGEAGVLTNLGNSYRRLGEMGESITCLEQSLEIFRESGDRAGTGIALANLGERYRDAGRFEESIACQRQALEIFQDLGSRGMEGNVLDNLARTYQSMGRYEEALQRCEEALAARRDTADRYGEAETLDCLGHIHQAIGRTVEARRQWSRALDLFDELDAPAAADVRAQLAGLARNG
ncbi:DNA-binding SARP family transcriptional activator/Flp pilus assembly protein TadD [Catenulispora sp. GAS73]|uniref:AfsR/SARP family transcriptional regulator n=1 Tax=Catenulispora sp. GAS73 TaxID=3156269 RepID=UPI003517DFB3